MRLIVGCVIIGLAILAGATPLAAQPAKPDTIDQRSAVTDTTSRRVLCTLHIMITKRDRFYIQLADSTTLLIDKRTPGGRYMMLDGRALDLAPGRLYPRAYSICTYLK